RVRDLANIAAMADGGLRIGRMSSHAEIARLQAKAAGPALVAHAAAQIGHAAIRNQGTIGGSLAHADPAADYPAALVCAGARISTVGAAGRRSVAAVEFFKGFYETALQPGEIIVAVEIPAGPPGGAAPYEKIALVPGDFAVIS